MNKIFFILLCVVFLSGCATSYLVKVNGYLDSTQASISVPSGVSFFVVTDKNVKNPIFENEIKSKIETLLKKKGYHIESYDRADLFLSFVYSISSGRVVTEVTPVYHSGETSTVRTYTSSGKERISYIDNPGYTTYIPHKFTVYISSLAIEVFDASLYRKSQERKEIWIGEASNTSEEPDIREAVNYLLVAAFAHFGENTHTSVTANILKNDLRVKELLH